MAVIFSQSHFCVASLRFAKRHFVNMSDDGIGGMRVERGEFEMDGNNARVITDDNGEDQKITWGWNKLGEIKSKMMAECIP